MYKYNANEMKMKKKLKIFKKLLENLSPVAVVLAVLRFSAAGPFFAWNSKNDLSILIIALWTENKCEFSLLLPIFAGVSDENQTNWFSLPVYCQLFAEVLAHSLDYSAKQKHWCYLSIEWKWTHICENDESDRIASTGRGIWRETRGHELARLQRVDKKENN